jgi:ABC-2 type transport system ATP-binding protein
MPEYAIEVENVRKRFAGNPTPALDGLTFAVAPGTVCGLLGPNGAGKTTAIRTLATLLRLAEGSATVAGFDVRRQADEVRRRIGLVGQHAAVDEVLGGRQNLVMFARLNHLPARRARERADELLERFGLVDAGRRAVSTYSGGMRRRLDLAASLLVTPEVLFVDEPTTGLDPQGRREVWESLRGFVASGTTVLLTTQYLEEADELADHIVLVDAGRVVAEGSPDALKSTIGGDRIDVTFAASAELDLALPLLTGLADGEPSVDTENCRIGLPVRERTRALVDVAVGLTDLGVDPVEINLRRPSLDEVFLQFTGVKREEVAA